MTAAEALADALALQGTSDVNVDALLVALEAAGFVVLDECARCGEDPRAHWCADLEETFN
jgi:hypothetical protein